MRLLVAQCGERVRRFPLPSGRATLGSAVDNDLVLRASGVSRHHASVVPTDEGLLLIDSSSKNGLIFAGARQTEVLLLPGRTVQVGSALLRLEDIASSEVDLALALPPSPPLAVTCERETRDEPAGPHATLSLAAAHSLGMAPEMVVGSSPAMHALLATIRATARSDLSFLLLGETGTGKELIASLLHRSGPAAKGPFVAVNCAAIPADLLEAELFGVVKGAATGVEPRPGRFAEADGGTLLLDEVGELPLSLQAKLLRVLQEREVFPLGARAPRRLQVRILSASNRSLEELVSGGTFRADLFFRLRGIELRLPPLRERREDLGELTLAFAVRAAAKQRKEIRGVSRRAFSLLARHDWPGNIRELKTAVEAAVALCADGGTLESRHFSLASVARTTGEEPSRQTNPGIVHRPPGATLGERIAAVEREAIDEALAATGGNKTQAARLLGITRNGLNLKLRRLAGGRGPIP
jgi:transcriptional regulator with PAS, ATPase and Fis domain